jgi:glycosyltransferase involved in cell wall biosynthesis
MSAPLHTPGEIEITILIPCKNEREKAVGTVDTALAALAESDRMYEILVVDDSSKDDTSGIVEENRLQHPDACIVLRRNPRNIGLSRTFIDGAYAARGKYYRLLAGDFCFYRTYTLRNYLKAAQSLGLRWKASLTQFSAPDFQARLP